MTLPRKVCNVVAGFSFWRKLEVDGLTESEMFSDNNGYFGEVHLCGMWMQCLNGHSCYPGALVKAAKGRWRARTKSRIRGAPLSVQRAVDLGLAWRECGRFISVSRSDISFLRETTQMNLNLCDLSSSFCLTPHLRVKGVRAFPKLPVSYPVLRLAPPGKGSTCAG